MKRKAIVIDIDNCVLDTQFIIEEIFKLGLKGDEKWEYFYENCNSDRVKVISEMKDILKSLYNEYFIILSTARNAKNWKQTSEKIKQENIWLYIEKIYMRDENDFRPACEVKREHLLQIMEEFNVIAFIDDDLQNCEVAKELGILALRRV